MYDNNARVFINTDTKKPDRSSKDKLCENPDGTVDIYVGLQEPTDPCKAANWIKSNPGEGWFAYFRLYGPTEDHFNGKWVLNDFVKVGGTL